MLTKKQRSILNSYIGEDSDDKAVLSIYPLRYEFREIIDESQWQISMKVLFRATIISAIKTQRFGNRSITRFRVMTDYNEYDCIIFNNRFVDKSLENQEVSIYGTLSDKFQIVVSQMNRKSLNELEGIFPVYSQKEGVTQYQIRSIIKKVLKENYHQIEEIIPEKYIKKYKLLTYREAIKEIHFPHSALHLKHAERTLKYAEALQYQVAIGLSKKENQLITKKNQTIDIEIVRQFISDLPFEMTDDQQQTIQSIMIDLQRPQVMRRLVMGDVGSGKTVVATAAILAMGFQSNRQIAFLCPTEVLAYQHYETLTKQIGQYIKVGLLTGSMSSNEKRDILDKLRNNEITCLIGTHSLFSEPVTFNNLKLVIMDEQHRFGVTQRQALLQKGDSVDVLMLSATPIPRTLASSLYSHIDISTIETMPINRQRVITKLIRENTITSILDELIERISLKDQVYVICPSIEEDNKLQVKNVKTITKNLKKEFGSKIIVEMIHGQMNRDEIASVLNDFRAHKIDMLVSTTVIEVGIHIENANTMVIYNGERFGLSQLHQLRGRIGRNEKQAVCYVLCDTNDQNSLQRLEMFEKESSGFALSMIDLKLRGSGDLLGIRQSGMPMFTIFNPIRDEKMLVESAKDAWEIINSSDSQEKAFVKKIVKIKDSIVDAMI